MHLFGLKLRHVKVVSNTGNVDCDRILFDPSIVK